MNREELKELRRGCIVATVTPFDDDFEVDYGRMAELTRWWVERGLVKGKAVLKVASMMGEVPQMRDDEWTALLRTTVQAAKGSAAVMAGGLDRVYPRVHRELFARLTESVSRPQNESTS